MLRCCKRPLDEDGPLYDAVTAPDSRAPIAPYLEARTLRPSVFHHGNRGLTRDRILGRGGAVRRGPRGDRRRPRRRPEPLSRMTGARGRTRRCARRCCRVPLARPKAPTRITHRRADRATCAGCSLFVVAALLVLSLPGLVLAPILPLARYLILVAAAR